MTQLTPEQVQQWADECPPADVITELTCIAQKAFEAGAASMLPEIDAAEKEIEFYRTERDAMQIQLNIERSIVESYMPQLAALRAQPVKVSVGVWEALQRLIENAATLGPASEEDALLVSKWRRQFWDTAPTVQESIKATPIAPDYHDQWLKQVRLNQMLLEALNALVGMIDAGGATLGALHDARVAIAAAEGEANDDRLRS